MPEPRYRSSEFIFRISESLRGDSYRSNLRIETLLKGLTAYIELNKLVKWNKH
jgi:hypothetical protein